MPTSGTPVLAFVSFRTFPNPLSFVLLPFTSDFAATRAVATRFWGDVMSATVPQSGLGEVLAHPVVLCITRRK